MAKPAIPQNAQLDELPHYWQRKIAKMRREGSRHRVAMNEAEAESNRLRAENQRLRARLRFANSTDRQIPEAWKLEKALQSVRSECARYRAERNALRAELESLRAEAGAGV